MVSFTFNPFTGTFDAVGGGGSSSGTSDLLPTVVASGSSYTAPANTQQRAWFDIEIDGDLIFDGDVVF